MPKNYRARPEQAIIITIEAWDGNCNSHIPHLIPAEEAVKMIDSLNQKIDVLQTWTAPALVRRPVSEKRTPRLAT
jgi:uncharacterized protein